MDWLYQFMSEWGYGALLITMILENMNIPIPSEVVLGFAGFLVSEGVFTYWTAVIVGTIAGIIGSLISYAIGYYGGRPLLLRYGRYIMLHQKELQRADNWFQRYGGLAVFTGRLLPGVRTFISLPAGMARYPLLPFIGYTVIGTIPWTMLLVWAGMTLGAHWQIILEYDLEILLGGLAIAGLTYLAYRYRHRHDHS